MDIKFEKIKEINIANPNRNKANFIASSLVVLPLGIGREGLLIRSIPTSYAILSELNPNTDNDNETIIGIISNPGNLLLIIEKAHMGLINEINIFCGTVNSMKSLKVKFTRSHFTCYVPYLLSVLLNSKQTLAKILFSMSGYAKSRNLISAYDD